MTLPALEWTEQEVNIEALKPYYRNPRTITKDAFERLKRRITKAGYKARIEVDADMTIISGHMRLKALKDLGMMFIKVLVPNRKLTKEEFDTQLLEGNIQDGKDDAEILAADYEMEFLKELGMDIAKYFPTPETEDKKLLDENPLGLCKKCPYKKETS